MNREDLHDYMQGYVVGLRGRPGSTSEVTSIRAWADGFKAGRTARDRAERTVSPDYLGLRSIRITRQDLLA